MLLICHFEPYITFDVKASPQPGRRLAGAVHINSLAQWALLPATWGLQSPNHYIWGSHCTTELSLYLFEKKVIFINNIIADL